MKLGKMIKRDAKAALRGSWGKAIAMLAAILGIGLCIDVIDAATFQLLGYDFQYVSMDVFRYSENFFYNIVALGISLAFAVVRIILLIPLGLGVVNWYLDLTDRKRGNVSSIFWAYESRAAIRSILLAFNVGIKMFLVGMAAFILPIGIMVAAEFATSHYALSMTLLMISFALILIVSLLIVAFSQRFALTQILLCDKYKLTTHQAVKQSVKYMKGHKWELVRFELSFLPWFLPLIFSSIVFCVSWASRTPVGSSHILWGVLTLIIYVLTMLFLTPYLTMARTIYCRYLYEYGVWNENQNKAVANPQENHVNQAEPIPEFIQDKPKHAEEPSLEERAAESNVETMDVQQINSEFSEELASEQEQTVVSITDLQPEKAEPFVTPNYEPTDTNDQSGGHGTSEKI